MLEIDVDRMKNGKELEARYTGGKSRGYPWSIVLDPEQKLLVSSDGPGGNIGCPVTPEEAAVFFDMLAETRSRLSDAELDVLRAEHTAFAKPILERTGR